MNTKNKINWSQFEVCNPNYQEAFEKMCRLLFKKYFFDYDIILHSNPNNPGVEVEPVLERRSGKRISFQAKYFENNVNYSAIKKSVDMITKYYANCIDILYLYCNKDLDKKSKPYEKIEEMLANISVELILINNQEILDQAISNSTISLIYFNKHGLTNDWFDNHLCTNLKNLGVKFNKNFNVDTNIEKYLNLYLHNQDAIIQINKKKYDFIERTKKLNSLYFKNRNLINDTINYIKKIDDITIKNVESCLSWYDSFKKEFFDEIEAIKKEINIKEDLLLELDKNNNEYNLINNEISVLEKFIDNIEILEFNNEEKDLIMNKVLFIHGDAGVGKTQLFANTVNNINKNKGYALLLLGNFFLTADPVQIQILSQLGLSSNINFEELLRILDNIGEEQNVRIPIFIDAINESMYKKIWEVGLIQLVTEINKFKFVRLAISIRTGYYVSIFNDTIKENINNNEITNIEHKGFSENPIYAMGKFLNYYDIPFLPSYLFYNEMTNPLFLTFFCKSYNGYECDIYNLFEKIINNVNNEVSKYIGYEGSTNIVMYFLLELISFQYEKNNMEFNEDSILQLGYWGKYGLESKKLDFLSALETSELIIRYKNRDKDYYAFSYNLFEDFICAKYIMNKFDSMDELRNYIKNTLMINQEDKKMQFGNMDIFMVVCNLFVERYNAECVDEFDFIEDEDDRCYIVRKYIESYIWRKSDTINKDYFVNLIGKYNISLNVVWKILINHSVNPKNPLNSKFLHDILMNKKISHRDYIWTTYINDLGYDEERIIQIIDYINEGNIFDNIDGESVELLLILFSWILTSSNRILRDNTSKAMIEILKRNFNICIKLLKRFEGVNDPYIIQRLYGIVFGACMKRDKLYAKEFEELVLYVYEAIFNKEYVYPDILLRDYSKLIIDRWKYEFPDIYTIINYSKVTPPYKSENIPIVEKEEYYTAGERYNGFNIITLSMMMNYAGSHSYGDFGRYIFNAALNEFADVNIENIYHYSMQYIKNELRYENDLFASYDSLSFMHYNRHETKKRERIGKKYQWITMYNVLARISDTHLIKKWDDQKYIYQGAWEPLVRDFDPTLNSNLSRPKELPEFNKSDYSNEFIKKEFPDDFAIYEWINRKCDFFANHKSKLIIKDNLNNEWVLLNQYEKNNYEPYPYNKDYIGKCDGEQEIWSMSHAYIVKQNEFNCFKNELENKSFLGRWFPECQDTYQLYNREHVWSEAYHYFFGDSWVDYEIDTGEKILKKYSSKIKKIFKNYDKASDDEIINFEDDEFEYHEPVKQVIGKVMPSYSNVSWSDQYDASHKECLSYNIPCKNIIDYLSLEQKEHDRFFYHENDIVAFDSELFEINNGLIIKKDYLKRYLSENDLIMFWVCFGEKQYYKGNSSQVGSDWSGFLWFENGEINGDMEYKGTQNNK